MSGDEGTQVHAKTEGSIRTKFPRNGDVFASLAFFCGSNGQLAVDRIESTQVNIKQTCMWTIYIFITCLNSIRIFL